MGIRQSRLALTAGLAIASLFAVLDLTVVPASATGTGYLEIQSLAQANIGKKACSTNSLGTKGYYHSCDAGGTQQGVAEAWCADFVRWVLNHESYGTVLGANEINPLASSVWTYAHGSSANYSKTPGIGYVAMFANEPTTRAGWSPGQINHVAIVTYVSGNNIKTVSGDWGVVGNNYAASTVQLNPSSGTYSGSFNSYSSTMNYYLVGYAVPVISPPHT
jgi:hypothetical protein